MDAHHAISLLIFALGAFSIPLLSSRVGVPAAVGEILFGIAFGPHLLGLIEPNPFTTFLAEFGFAFLMFLVGLELDFSKIQRQGLRGFGVAIVVVVMMFALGAAATHVLQLPGFMFLVFGSVSLGILMVTLNEAKMTKGAAGQTMIFVGSVGEFATIVLLTAMGMYYEIGLGWRLAIEMGKLLLIFAAAYLALIILRTLIWWWPQSFARVVAAKDPTEVGVRAAMALMLVFVALATLMGVESILGSFIAGALFSFVFREKEALEGKMGSLGFGFFVPIFFIWVGSEFELSSVLRVDILPLVLLLLIALVASKILPSLLLLFSGLRLRESVGAGMLFATPLTLLVVIASIGQQVNVIDKPTAGAVVLLAIVSGVLFPFLFRLLLASGADPPEADSPGEDRSHRSTEHPPSTARR